VWKRGSRKGGVKEEEWMMVKKVDRKGKKRKRDFDRAV